MKWHMPDINGRKRRAARRRRLMRPDLPNLRETPVWSGWGKKPIWLAAIALLLTIIGIGAIATPGRSAILLEAPLSLNAGEDPSVSAQFLANGRGTWDGAQVRVQLMNMDPARFSLGLGCQTEVRAGAINAKGVALQSDIAEGSDPPVATTTLDFRQNGTAAAGDPVEVRIRCEFGGQRHETQWQGVFGAVAQN